MASRDDPGAGGGGPSEPTAAPERKQWPRAPLLTRLVYATIVYGLQILLIKPAMAGSRLYWSLGRPAQSPSKVKTYPCRRNLPVRIFFPRDRQPEQKHPLLFTIHGGGFVLGDPSDNDVWNASFADQHSTLVIGLNYAKAPGSPFPGPLSDIEALITAILADAELMPHFDPSQMAVLGWSAGGNLALGIAQFPAFRGKFGAVVPIYPILDFAATPASKTKTRPYKPSLGGFRGSKKDYLFGMAPLFDWAYVPVGTDARDPLLSPEYVDKANLPERVWVIGCELDMLGHEAWRLISRLAGRAVPTMDQVVGQDGPLQDENGKPKKGELILSGNQRFAFEEKNRSGEYKWLLIPDAVHGFDQGRLKSLGADKAAIEDGGLKRDKAIKLIGEWLWR